MDTSQKRLKLRREKLQAARWALELQRAELRRTTPEELIPTIRAKQRQKRSRGKPGLGPVDWHLNNDK